jgi:WD40 repeat protein
MKLVDIYNKIFESELYYHGSPMKDVVIDNDLPIFISKNPEVADFYAGRGGFFGDPDSGSIVKVKFDDSGHKILTLSAEEYMELLDPNFRNNWGEDGYNPPYENNPMENYDHVEDINNKLISRARSGGYGAIKIIGDMDATPLRDLDHTQIIVIDHALISVD